MYRNEEYRKFAVWAAPFDETRNKAFLGKPGITAEMYSDWQGYPSLAAQFWMMIFEESHADPDHDTRELAHMYKEWQALKKGKAIKAERYQREAKTRWARFKKNIELTAAEEAETTAPPTLLPPPPPAAPPMQATL